MSVIIAFHQRTLNGNLSDVKLYSACYNCAVVKKKKLPFYLNYAGERKITETGRYHRKGPNVKSRPKISEPECSIIRRSTRNFNIPRPPPPPGKPRAFEIPGICPGGEGC